ncbi:hypothetical protein [Paenibacillus taichungensis]|uniref:hypothetical protein n=1 Tax=Paenibacillus taichungensis TaxID=484184 RepID=UPI0038D08D63
MKKGIESNGTVFANQGDVVNDEFLDKFIAFIESNGWGFGGGSKQIDEDGNDI